MPIKLLLDTDIGTDIDDAVCLAYLLAQPECDLLGITTVTGQAEQRARIASAICRAAGREPPIYPGAESPLLVSQMQTQAAQAAALPAWPHQTGFPHGQAVNFMQRTIRENPGEVTLLTIGPLTNVALLFALDPEIPGLLKRLVTMAGMYLIHYAQHRAETNIRLDPHAAAIVFRAAKKARLVGLDVTLPVWLPRAEVRARFTAPVLRPVLDFAEVWFEGRDSLTFHDPLAAATIFDEGLCSFEPGQANVDFEAEKGRTRWRPGNSGAPHEIGVEVDPERFFTHFFGVFDRDRP